MYSGGAPVVTTSFQPTSRSRLWWRFAVGMAWLAMVAGGLTLLTDYPFALVYAAMVCGALFTSGLAITWLFRWAVNEQAREGQFALSSLLFFTTFAAIYFAAIRWIVVHIEAQVQQRLPWQGLVFVAFACTLLAILTCPAVLCVTEALLWFAVWLVRWPPARPVWRFFLKRGGQSRPLIESTSSKI
jgi:hypothetical protein